MHPIFGLLYSRLVRWAGPKYKHYKNIENSICSNKVNSLSESKDGKIWIGTKGGLSVYDPKSERVTCHFNEDKNIARGDNIIISVFSSFYLYI